MSWANFEGEPIAAPVSEFTPVCDWDSVINRLVKAMHEDRVPERKIAAYFGRTQKWVRQITDKTAPVLRSA